MKSGTFMRPTRVPLNNPTIAPVASPTKMTKTSGHPSAKTRPIITLASVTVVAIERSMPPMAITNVIPSARTMISDESASIPRMFCSLRKTGERAVKMTERTTRAIGAVQFAQKSASLSRRLTRTPAVLGRGPGAACSSDSVTPSGISAAEDRVSDGTCEGIRVDEYEATGSGRRPRPRSRS